MLNHPIKSAAGKLGILLPGMGAVSTTLIAGCLLSQKGLAQPIGSLTQMGTLSLHSQKTDEQASAAFIRDLLPLASMSQLVFGGWDLFADNAYEAAKKAAVLSESHLEAVRQEMSQIAPMPAVFFPEYVKNLHGQHRKKQSNKWQLAQSVREDIRGFKDHHQLDRAVAVWCGSTEKYQELDAVHQSLEAFEQGLKENHSAISPSMVYAYACLQEAVPFANGAPHLSCDIPALVQLAEQKSLPLSGKDFKTGQTLMKTVVAPGLKARMLGINGWFSTNILGNRDGEVLDDPDNFRSKEVSKLGVLENILQPQLHPQLYEKMYHKVRIDYYPPRGDQKEGWDNIDIFGWLGYPMQIKINFLCRDSILAAPLVLDLALLMDLAARAKLAGVQQWLSFFYKSPMMASEDPQAAVQVEHDLFAQMMHLKNQLRLFAGEDISLYSGLQMYR